MHPDDHPTVYSTEHGDLRKQAKTQTVSQKSLPPNQQTAYLHRDSKGRAGRSVTLIKNLQMNAEDMKELAKKLKQACGVGGTVKDGLIEIQSEQREKIAEVLRGLGYKVKIAGG